MANEILVVDLNKKTSYREDIPEKVMEQYVGGRGLGARLLWERVGSGVDPLSPENELIFTTGALQGTGMYFSGRSFLATKSPLTGIYLYSNAGGELASELRRMGLWALVVRGVAAEPTYLVVEDGRVSFRPAEHLWGMGSRQAQTAIRKEAGSQFSTAVIGPAGEKLIKLACIVTSGDHARVFGRGGAGAVMGSKLLKGIAVRGTGTINIDDPGKFNQAKKAVRETLKANASWAEMRKKYGTGMDLHVLNKVGYLPTRNWYTGFFEDAEKIAPYYIREQWTVRNVSCSKYCLTPCSKISRVSNGPYAGYETDGPEYETIYAFGSNCGNADYAAIIAVDHLCDELGLDTISTGVVIGWAMECAERGWLNSSDLEGLNLHFGNTEAMVTLVKQIGQNEGLGRLLGQGVKKAAEIVGGKTATIAMHSKGLEFGGYECRGAYGQALQFALSNRGGCHHDLGLPARLEVGQGNGTVVKGKGELVKKAAIVRVIYDSASVCSFARNVLGIEPVVSAIEAVLGKGFTVSRLELAAERILNLERLYNVREGIRRRDDRLPDRLLFEPLPDGPCKGSVVPLEDLKDDFYEAFGWDRNTGIPRDTTLRKLTLDSLVW